MLQRADAANAVPDDVELLRRFAQRRDDEAFGRLVARHADSVRRAASRATGNPSAAEDVAQAAFIVMSRRPRAALLSARCRGGNALPWLVRTARYAASTWRRTEARRRRHESAAAVADRLDPSNPGELTEAVASALSRMNRGERRLITLRHLDEKPWPDVAHATGMTPEAARKATARALARLRERLRHAGIVASPAALAIALGTIARPARAATLAAGGSAGAFVLARGVLTMMQIKTAGLAGTAVLAAAMTFGVLSGGFGPAGATLAAGAGGAIGAQDQDERRTERRTERRAGRGENADRAEGQDRDPEPRPERFEPNEHQPGLDLPDGSRLTLLALSNGEDGWWHADGTRSRAPRRYLPEGVGMASMNITFDEGESMLDMVMFVERRGAGEADADEDGEAEGQRQAPGAEIVRVMNTEGEQPDSIALGINSSNGRASWRVIIPHDGEERAGLLMALANGRGRKAGEVVQAGQNAWRADEDAQEWITIGAGEDSVFFEPAKGAGDGAAAISVVGITANGGLRHGYVEDNRMVFDKATIGDVERFEVHRRPVVLVRMENLSMRPEQATRPRLAIDEDAEPRRIMAGASSVNVATAGGAGQRSSVNVVTGDGDRARAEAHGGGEASLTTIDGHDHAKAGGGAQAHDGDHAHAEAHGGGAKAGAAQGHGAAAHGGGGHGAAQGHGAGQGHGVTAGGGGGTGAGARQSGYNPPR